MSPKSKQITMRVFAATLPAYILANTGAILLGFVLPGSKIDATYIASLLSFVIYACIVLWIFHIEQLKKMWLYLLLAIVLSGLASWLLFLLETNG